MNRGSLLKIMATPFGNIVNWNIVSVERAPHQKQKKIQRTQNIESHVGTIQQSPYICVFFISQVDINKNRINKGRKLLL